MFKKLTLYHSVLKNLNGSQQLPRTDLELVKIEPGTRKGLIFIIKNLENNRIDHYMSYNQPDALSNFRLQCRWVRIIKPLKSIDVNLISALRSFQKDKNTDHEKTLQRIHCS